MATQKTVMKKVAKKAAKKAVKRTPVTTANIGIHPPPCAPDEIEFDDPVTGRRMCRKVP
jgi:hypothetical protein